MKMEQTECSETSAYKIQTPGNYPEENIQHFVIFLEPQPPEALMACLGHKETLNTLFRLQISAYDEM